MSDLRVPIAASTPLEAVLLDCLGTLVRLEPPAPLLRTELARRGIEVSEDRAEAAFRAEIDYYLAHHLEGSDPPALERLRDACARVILDVLELAPGDHAGVRAAMLAALRFRPQPDAAPALRALRAAGLRLVVASNWDCSLPRVIERAGLRDLVDGVVTSAEVGAAKPAPGPIRAALDLAGCDPDRALLIGDSLEHDVAAARAAGVRAVLLQRRAAGRCREFGGELALVRSLDEARSLILGAP